MITIITHIIVVIIFTSEEYLVFPDCGGRKGKAESTLVVMVVMIMIMIMMMMIMMMCIPGCSSFAVLFLALTE